MFGHRLAGDQAPRQTEEKAMEVALGAYLISTDRKRLKVDAIHEYLSRESYWARGVTREKVADSIANSLCFGVYHGVDQVGFARVVTDRATFAWLADVYVLPDHRGAGLGKRLVEAVVAHPWVRPVRRLMLATADAHGLYEQYGLRALDRPQRFMAIETDPTGSIFPAHE
jgi:GNAT superfamily N-acetyltransferase